jgi:uncharacterized membrane protein YsdA (DUF1294 family)
VLNAVIALTAWYFLVSALTFGVYAFDKHRAIRADGSRRVPEATLHLLALAGGFAGAIFAMRIIRHKNRKLAFVALTWAIALLHGLIWAGTIALRR